MRFVEIEPSAPRKPSTSALFDSTCPGCGDEITEGDQIVFDQDAEEWLCEGCTE